MTRVPVSANGDIADGPEGPYVLAEPRSVTGGCFLQVVPGAAD